MPCVHLVVPEAPKRVTIARQASQNTLDLARLSRRIIYKGGTGNGRSPQIIMKGIVEQLGELLIYQYFASKFLFLKDLAVNWR